MTFVVIRDLGIGKVAVGTIHANTADEAKDRAGAGSFVMPLARAMEMVVSVACIATRVLDADDRSQEGKGG